MYVIHNRREPSPLLARYAFHVWTPQTSTLLQKAPSICSASTTFDLLRHAAESGPTIRTVKMLDVRRKGELIRVEIRADGFLHRMVRTIAGTLVECGSGRRDPIRFRQYCRPAIVPLRD